MEFWIEEGGEKEKNIRKNDGHNFSKFAENHKTADSRSSVNHKGDKNKIIPKYIVANHLSSSDVEKISKAVSGKGDILYRGSKIYQKK